MEIPLHLQNLYSHWEKHSNAQIQQESIQELDPKLITEIETFITERMNIWEKKTQESKPPYTKDPILSQYRFCNIYRELDRQTIEIHTKLKPFKENLKLWLLNLAFYRFVCNPATIENVGLLNFDKKNNENVYKKLLNLKSPKYGTAYIFPISTIQKSEFDTRERFFALYLPKIIPHLAKIMDEFSDTTVLQSLDKILPRFGFNLKFHWTEILIDVAYQFPEKINLFQDFYIGPGALPTIKRFGDDTQKVLDQLVSQKLENFPYLTLNGKPILLSAENWEGICCEFRKYTNLKNGFGRKRIYRQNRTNLLKFSLSNVRIKNKFDVIENLNRNGLH